MNTTVNKIMDRIRPESSSWAWSNDQVTQVAEEYATLQENKISIIETLRRLLEVACPVENGALSVGKPIGTQFTDEERKIIKDKLMEAVKSL